mgnify:CR=1 FL=1
MTARTKNLAPHLAASRLCVYLAPELPTICIPQCTAEYLMSILAFLLSTCANYFRQQWQSKLYSMQSKGILHSMIKVVSAVFQFYSDVSDINL